MMSGKQRRKEIMANRRERIRLQARTSVFKLPRPAGSVLVDPVQLAHNNTYGLLPLFYMDRAFVCRDCGAAQIWTAKQQKWWYENAHGNINSTAVRCRPCRKKEQERKAQARRVHLGGLERKRMDN
ncbi:MAG: hypothetical protein A3I66_14825 [Burkholderiales bacterium RIFCSPLOWO2_02_FULL_57_36]|nr:MAG: hypothetical protein A3I66_14825 [Burkholderiales bacterium RIFCSPLOWO2_02_FULL_57_36]